MIYIYIYNQLKYKILYYNFFLNYIIYLIIEFIEVWKIQHIMCIKFKIPEWKVLISLLVDEDILNYKGIILCIFQVYSYKSICGQEYSRTIKTQHE